MTSKIIVNNIGSDTGINTVTFDSNLQRGTSNLHSTGLNVSDTFLHSTGLNVGTGATIHQPADNVMTLGTNGSERLRITSTGVVGITTDASGNGSGAKLVVGGRVQSNNGGYWFADANGAENGWHVQDSGGNLIIVESGVAERLRIGSSGQIGLGGANYGSSGQVLTSQGSGSAVQWASVGTEVYDTWIYTAETNVYAAGNYLTANWSRFGDNIGSAMTQSSGVFSFPSTGYYRVTFTCNFFERNSPDNIAYIYIQTTTDNNATAYVTRAASLQNITDRSGDTYTTCHAHILFDVTNLTTHKVRFFAASDASGDLRIAGAPTYQQVYATFQKVGNT